MQTDTVTLENSQALFKNVDYIAITQPHSSTAMFKHEVCHVCSPKDMHKTVHSSIIQNSPKLETTEISTNGKKDKHTLLYSHTG